MTSSGVTRRASSCFALCVGLLAACDCAGEPREPDAGSDGGPDAALDGGPRVLPDARTDTTDGGMLMDAQADAALDASPDGDAALPDAGTPDATVCTDGVVTIQPVELDGHMRSMPEWPAVFASCPAAGSTEAEVRVYRGRPPELIFEGTLPCDDTGIRLPPLPAGSYMVAVRATSSVTRGVYIAGWIGRWCTEITRCASPVIDPCAALCVRVPDSCEPVQVSARLECSNAESRIRDLCFYP